MSCRLAALPPKKLTDNRVSDAGSSHLSGSIEMHHPSRPRPLRALCVAFFPAVFGGFAWRQCAGGGSLCVAGPGVCSGWRGCALCAHMWTHICAHCISIPQPDKRLLTTHGVQSSCCAAAQKTHGQPRQRRRIIASYWQSTVVPPWLLLTGILLLCSCVGRLPVPEDYRCCAVL